MGRGGLLCPRNTLWGNKIKKKIDLQPTDGLEKERGATKKEDRKR